MSVITIRKIGLLVCLSTLLCGCKKSPSDSTSKNNQAPLKLAFVTNNASDFWKIAAAGVHKYEQESGVQVDIKMPTSENALSAQKQIIENLLSQGYDGIAVSVVAPSDETAEINAAAKKTNIICQDSDAPDSDRLLYIGTNNFQAGKVLGDEIVKLLPNGGKMAVFVGTFSADNARKRLAGVEEAIKGHNIEIIAKKEDNKDANKARSNVENVINAYPDVKLLCGLWSYNGPAIASAVDAAGKKGKILVACFDEEDGTLDGIKSGTVSCTVVQKPFQFGYLSSKWLHELATKGKSILPKDPNIDTGVEVIKADNVDDFRKRLADMKK
ncbi:MAG TPA: sugar-binding protein [Tepidisphaeraceae bacterium]|jgi:ribose transport system substrate-binding protein|nr:sugar-binding protein [Tepidisphaeraceae bacterium]